jgi:hypothetical protein
LHGGESVLDFGCWPILTKSSSLGISWKLNRSFVLIQ